LRVSARVDHQDIPADSRVTRLRVVEGLSTLFDIHVEVRCADAELDLEALIWSTAAVVIAPVAGDVPPRAFHGVVEQAHYDGFDRHWHVYRLRLRPNVHGLAYRIRTRIFQEQNTVDIVSQVFADAGVPSDGVRWDTAGDYSVRTYCTQWKESELAFVLRLLEDEGIFYWFEHTEVDHLLCLGDGPSVHEMIEGDPILPLVEDRRDVTEGVWDPRSTLRRVHDAFRSRDWDFEAPQAPLEALTGDEGVRRRYEYPGGYGTNADGSRLARTRIEEAWHRRVVFEARTNCTRVMPGRKLEVVDVFPEALARDYLVVRVEHELEIADAGEGTSGEFGEYRNRIECIPADTAFRPPRVTPKPLAHGMESAVVTGPAGEEIHVDEFGRIKVHFYWDRENPVDDTASCWIRFQQLNTYGAMILPRIGWEVHVAFVDGDPDRPVALHKAYNQETLPPYELPANKTQSAMQSSTSPGGGSTNEIRLQDGNGGMEWFLHSSKDLNVTVANDQNETVGVDASETVGSTMQVGVTGDEAGTVGGNQALSVTGACRTETVGSKSVSIGGNDDWGITGSYGFTTTGDRTETIGGLMNVLANKVAETFKANHTRSVGAVQAIVSATAIAETVGGNKTETVSAAKAILTPAEHGESIEGVKVLNCGAATFKTGGDVQYTAKGAIALTAAGLIDIEASDDVMFTGSQVRVTCGSAEMKGGGGKFKLGGSITIDAKKFGGKSGPMLEVKGTIDYK